MSLSRIRKAFDRDALARICVMPEDDFARSASSRRLSRTSGTASARLTTSASTATGSRSEPCST